MKSLTKSFPSAHRRTVEMSGCSSSNLTAMDIASSTRLLNSLVGHVWLLRIP